MSIYYIAGTGATLSKAADNSKTNVR